jgi:hypothetical protein
MEDTMSQNECHMEYWDAVGELLGEGLHVLSPQIRQALTRLCGPNELIGSYAVYCEQELHSVHSGYEEGAWCWSANTFTEEEHAAFVIDRAWPEISAGIDIVAMVERGEA